MYYLIKERVEGKISAKKSEFAAAEYRARVVYVDGGVSGNNQKDLSKRRMLAVVCDDEGNVLLEQTYRGGSSNIAEFLAIVEAMKLCSSWEGRKIISSDSSVALGWIRLAAGGRIPKASLLRRMNDPDSVLFLFKEFARFNDPKVGFQQVPREHNLAGKYIEENYGL